MRRLATAAAMALTAGAGLITAAPAQAATGDQCSNAVTWQGWKIQACITLADVNGDINAYTKWSNVGARTDVWIDVELWLTCDGSTGWYASSTGGYHATPTGATSGSVYAAVPAGSYLGCQYETYGKVVDNDTTMTSNWSPTISY